MKIYFITLNGPIYGQEVLCKGITQFDDPMYFLHINNLTRNEKNHCLVLFSEEELKKFHDFQKDGHDENDELKGFSYKYWTELFVSRIGVFMQAKSIDLSL